MKSPSPFGSHRSMIETFHFQEVSGVMCFTQQTPGMVTLLDNNGYYETFLNRLDSGLADPRRHNRPDATK